MKNLITTLILLFTALNLNSATHTVTNGNDSGEGSLRQIVAEANPNDTIIFLSNVSTVTLTNGQITINKNLTINGGSGDKRVVISRYIDTVHNIHIGIFRITVADIDFRINNLIIENGKGNAGGGGLELRGQNNNFIATNCIFRNNTIYGALAVFGNHIVITKDCLFEQNQSQANGAAVFVGYGSTNFIATNCVFVNNISESGGGAVALSFGGPRFYSVNNTFTNNNAFGGGVATVHTSYIHLHHSTFDKNQAKDSAGAMFIHNTATFYTYNSIYTGNTENGIVSEAGQIRGTVSGNGKNLIENGTTVTREKVFGKNEYKDGYIMPLAFAKSAPRLTKLDIEVPEGIEADSIITWLLKDQRGEDRSSDTVTFGAVEFDGVGIREDGSFDILVLPNPTDRDFNIIFDNPETQKVSVDLIDIEGKIIFSIFDGVVSAGIQVYRVNETLASGVYFVRFVFGNKVMLRKVVVV